MLLMMIMMVVMACVSLDERVSPLLSSILAASGGSGYLIRSDVPLLVFAVSRLSRSSRRLSGDTVKTLGQQPLRRPTTDVRQESGTGGREEGKRQEAAREMRAKCSVQRFGG